MLHFWCFLYFSSYECCLLDFSERFLSFWYIIACTSTVLVFINISLMSTHSWHYFSRMVVDSATRLTHMHLVPFHEFVIHHLHACSFTYPYTQYHHAFTLTFVFSCPSASLGNLNPNFAFTETTFHNLGNNDFVFLSRNEHFYWGTVL